MSQAISTGPSDALLLMRHSTAHLMAAAIQALWPEARFGVGPSTRDGFYYDFDLPQRISADDLPTIEKKMKELQRKGLPYERMEVSLDDAVSQMAELHQDYKIELLKLLREKGSTAVAAETGDDDAVGVEDGSSEAPIISLYKLGDFLDLCRGPHLPSSKNVGHFKLTSLAGAYWRGNEKNPQLQRIYGTVFETREELDHHLWQIEEAKKRDHRRLGQQLEIFAMSDEVGQGLPLWLPNGTVLREELERLGKEQEHRRGYQRVSTPVITKEALYYRSGHLPYYREDMYAPIEIDGDSYFLRPMNCPHHHQVYLAKPRSYRDLPLRLAEYGEVFRYEQSGVMNGIMRVRGFTQNDAHLYCRYDQAKQEFIEVMRLHAYYYDLLGIDEYFMRFSKPDLTKLDKYVDDPEKWLAAMDIIKEAMDESGYPYIEAEGEAAFYGPKIDFMIRSSVGTEYAISTNQLDFVASERFDLNYTGEDGQKHPVYVIHRAPLGSHERFIAFLLEHYAGAFPVWLAPVQAIVIPIADRHNDYGNRVLAALLDADVPTAMGGMRAEVDDARESMQKKIRNAQNRKIPYMLVVGDREEEENTVAVRFRGGQQSQTMPLDAFIERVRTEVKSRKDSPA